MAETESDLNLPEGQEGHERCLEQLQRERADFLNYKRRVDRERAEERDRTRQETLRELLPAIDDLDRAFAHQPPDLRGHPWAEGIALAHQRFLDTLRRLGVERVGNEGERFDPAVHDAVVYREHPTATEQHVQSVVRPGYRVGSQLLRPAQVVVTGPPANGRTDTPADAAQGRHHEDGQSYRH
jgi:molecular chaperone GrpE